MEHSLLFSTASIVVAASAFYVSWLVYRGNRQMPNENKLFEEKIKSYGIVIRALNTCAAKHIELVLEYDELTDDARIENQEDMDDELSEAYYLMEDSINEQILWLSDEVLESIDKYLELFIQNDTLADLVGPGKAEDFEKQTHVLFDEVTNAMREDLSIETLEIGLNRRIGGRTYIRRKQQVV